MLIYLDSSLITYFDENKATAEDIDALENIISSHRNSNHYVFANRLTLDYFSENSMLSLGNAKQLRMLYSNYATLAPIINKVATKIIVTTSLSSFRRRNTVISIDDILDKKENVTSIFEIPLKKFVSTEISEKTRLISEHIDDCKLYEFMSNEFLSLQKLPFKISFDKVHGGGNDTHKVFLDKITNNHISLSIVDSDKKEPQSTIGNTARQVTDVYNSNKQTSIIGCEILPVHEKENLFSPIIYEKFGRNIDETSLQQLKNLTSNDKNNFYYAYLDLKKGLHKENFTSFHTNIFNLLEGIDDEKKERFLNNSTLQTESKEPKSNKEYIIKPLGSNPLGDFDLLKIKNNLERKIITLHENTPQKIYDQYEDDLLVAKNILNHLLDFQKKYFHIFLKNICEWGLSNTRTATSGTELNSNVKVD